MTSAEHLATLRGAPRGDRDGTKLVPMLCERDDTSERILGEAGWLFELKLDGVRIVADKREDRVALGYRKGRDATESYPEIAQAVAELSTKRVVLDGEVVAFDALGRPDFQRLGTRIQATGEAAREAARRVPVTYVVFDILVLGERDLTCLPIEDRKAILEELLGASSRPGSALRLHPTLPDGKLLFAFCREHELEGVVAKRAGSPYRACARSSDWVKVKCELEADLVVVGWTPGEGGRTRLGALDVGVYDGDHLLVRGSVGSGLHDSLIDPLVERLLAIEVASPVAFGNLRKKEGRRYVKPEIVVSVRFASVTREGVLRHPVFRGFRPDVDPRECTLLSMSHAFVRPLAAR